ncbi:SGT1 protein-domain-containing protein [Cunninghamella echinulata]|nr:SGT1 protein-domain-containing protein [Cunninghamella echinulata]
MGSLLKNVFDGLVTTDINYIQYAIYLPFEKSTPTQLDQTRSSIFSFIKPLLKDYLWQKDGFQLSITHSNRQDPSYPFLFGVTRFGDCLHDEWFIIYLLYQVSTQFSEVVITVSDNDGDVLLIEAALELPPWLDPSNSENRVYIYQGQLHIIPLPKSPTDLFNMIPSVNKTLTRQQGIEYLRQHNSNKTSSTATTVASASIQKVLHQRIKDYPDPQLHYSRTHFHSLKAAWVILMEPQLLTFAIEAFYLRDPISLKHCITMSTFLSSPASLNEKKGKEKLTPINVVIPWTRTTFAQTLHQSFYPPKPFPPFHKDDPDFMMKDMGMKLTCGLEMLYHQLKQQNDGKKKNVNDDCELENDDDDLVTRDDLLKQVTLQNGDMTPLERIEQLLNEYSADKLNQLLSTMKQREKEDSLDWLYVYPDELESMLNNKMDREEGEEEMPINLEDMMKKFESFLEKNQSDVTGVRLPGEQEEEEEDDDDDDEELDSEEENQDFDGYMEEDVDKQISFDFNNFMKILNQGVNVDSLNDTNTETAEDLNDMMKQMDKEINEYDKISRSFKREEEDEDKPVNVELNLIENVLQSFKGQQGLPGPAGNLLKQFGIALPVDHEGNDDDDNDDE